MEKTEKKNIKIVKFLWIIPIVLGLIIGTVGISKIKQANDMYVPDMSESGWFDASNSQMMSKSLGIFLCVFGFLFVMLMGTIIVYVITHSNLKNAIGIEKSIINGTNIIQEILEKSNENKQPEQKYCKYCGANITGKNECPSCGTKDTK